MDATVTEHTNDELVAILALVAGNEISASTIESAIYDGEANCVRALSNALRGHVPVPSTFD